jgi:hypothetical protein
VDDREVIRAFGREGARQGFGNRLHIERDGLLLDGWWHAAFRVSPGVFIVRTDEPPEPSSALEQLAEELGSRGLQGLGEDFPLVTALTYAELSLAGGPRWALWASDQAAGEEALRARLSAESSLTETDSSYHPPSVEERDLTAELEGARRVVGLPPTVVVAVGLAESQVQQLRMALPDCRLETFDLREPPEACGLMGPSLVLVDATDQPGRAFVIGLRASACGRFVPVAAVAPGDEPPLGADLALDPGADAHSWAAPIRELLP